MNNQTPRRTNQQQQSTSSNLNSQSEFALVETKFVSYDHFNKLHKEATGQITKLQEKQDEINAAIKSIILSNGAYNLQTQTPMRRRGN
ncbi:hypothetical protein ACQ4LE_008610 [Meloidogyne hapla]|uniref:Uncharacterized protein n=1 Tax=Meloidogyne hapla TaxID=6305 RepID=A0A1I8AZB0_MELHA